MTKWLRVDSKITRDYRIFRSREDTYRSPEGLVHPFVVLESCDWVNVIALTTEQQVVMIRQFRHGVREETWEFPGGMVDAGESPLQAAQRELLEETGYGSEDWQPLGWVYPNPAIQENRCFTFLAKGARQLAEPHLDPTEELHCELWPLADLRQAFRANQITHALIVVAWQQFSQVYF